jgi:hypothetical protein
MKKHQKFLSNIAILAFIVISIFWGCRKDTINQISFREELVKGKTPIEIKDNYLKLSGEKQLNLWKSKIDQLLNQSLPEAHLALIKKLKSELSKFKSQNDITFNGEIQKIAINLAEITPEIDFLKMFVMLEDYKFKSRFEGIEICHDCISDMSKQNESILPNKALETRAGNCNCEWTCGVLELITGNSTSSNCTATKSGCGFLWLSSCEHRVDL